MLVARSAGCSPMLFASIGRRWLSSSVATSSRNASAVGDVAGGLNVAVFTGSTREEGPPFPARVGLRVGRWVSAQLEQRGHTVTVVDPVEVSLPMLRKPQFAYPPGGAPANLEELAATISAADAYVMVSPEYNHSVSPALANTLNHFGSSRFSYKPSGIVSYSQGQWGGTRAAIAMRPLLSELGCLPVSAMVHVPRAQEVLDQRGQVRGSQEEEEQWAAYFGRMAAQVEWWGAAARSHKAVADPYADAPAFASKPSQRNAPS